MNIKTGYLTLYYSSVTALFSRLSSKGIAQLGGECDSFTLSFGSSGSSIEDLPATGSAHMNLTDSLNPRLDEIES